MGKNRCRAGYFRAFNIRIPTMVLSNQDRRFFVDVTNKRCLIEIITVVW